MVNQTDHYLLAQDYGATAYWPLNHTGMSTTVNTITELLGGSDGGRDRFTPNGTGTTQASDNLMRSSVSDASLKCANVASGPICNVELGNISPADNMTIEFWWKWDAHVVSSSGNALFGWSLGATGTRITANWKTQFLDQYEFHLGAGTYTYNDSTMNPAGLVLTSPCHYVQTQKKEGSNYTGYHYLNGTLIYTSATSTSPWFGHSTGSQDGWIILYTKLDSNGPDQWFQSVAYYPVHLTSDKVSKLYSAGKL